MVSFSTPDGSMSRKDISVEPLAMHIYGVSAGELSFAMRDYLRGILEINDGSTEFALAALEKPKSEWGERSAVELLRAGETKPVLVSLFGEDRVNGEGDQQHAGAWSCDKEFGDRSPLDDETENC